MAYDYQNSYYKFSEDIINYQGNVPPLIGGTFEYTFGSTTARNNPGELAEIWKTYLEIRGDSDFTLIRFVSGNLLNAGNHFVTVPAFHHAYMQYSIAPMLLARYGDLGDKAGPNLSPKGLYAYYKGNVSPEQFDYDMLARAWNYVDTGDRTFFDYIQDASKSYKMRTDSGRNELAIALQFTSLDDIKPLIGMPSMFGGLNKEEDAQKYVTAYERKAKFAAFLKVQIEPIPDYAGCVKNALAEQEGRQGNGVVDLAAIHRRFDAQDAEIKEIKTLLQIILAEIAQGE